MSGQVASFLLRNHLALLALASMICFAASYATSNIVTELEGLGPDLRPGTLAVPAATLGLGIILVQAAVVLALIPEAIVAYNALWLVLSFLVALAGVAIGLRLALKGPCCLAVGGGTIGASAVAANQIALSALSVPPVMHRHYLILLLGALACIGFCSTGLSALRMPLRRATMVAALLLAIGILSFDLIVGMTLSLHAHALASGQASEIVDRWVAASIFPTASIILALAFLAGLIGRYVSQLAETKRRLQVTMEDLQRALTHAERANDTRAQFMAHMSHELRTPLNAVLGFSDLINQQTFGPISDRYREYVQIIHDSGAHLLGLINQVLDIAKIDAGRLELAEDDVDVGEVIRASMRLVSCQADEKGIALEADVARDLPFLFADNRMLRQILLNLLGNAVKFTPKGGTVKVSAELAGEGLKLSIADTGIGISAADRPHVFERFGQVQNAFTREHDGTGLGLPLAKEFIEAHQGHIELDSTPGIGTTVTAIFPASRLHAGAAAPERRQESPARPAAGLMRA